MDKYPLKKIADIIDEIAPHISADKKEKLMMIGYLGYKSVEQNYNPETKIPFSTCADFGIKYFILKALEHQEDILPKEVVRNKEGLLGLTFQLEMELGRPPTENDLRKKIYGPQHKKTYRQLIKELEKGIDNDLTRKEQLVISLHHADGFNIKDVSQILEIDTKEVSKIYSEARSKLQNIVNKYENF